MPPEDRSLPGERSAAGTQKQLGDRSSARRMDTLHAGWELVKAVVLQSDAGRLLAPEVALAIVKGMKNVPVGATGPTISIHAHPQPLEESLLLGEVRLPHYAPACRSEASKAPIPTLGRWLS